MCVCCVCKCVCAVCGGKWGAEFSWQPVWPRQTPVWLSSTDCLAPKIFIFISKFCFFATKCSFLLELYEQNSAPPPRQTVRKKCLPPSKIALEKYFLLLLPLLRFIKIQNKEICLMPPSSPFLSTSPSSPLPSCPPPLGNAEAYGGLGHSLHSLRLCVLLPAGSLRWRHGSATLMCPPPRLHNTSDATKKIIIWFLKQDVIEEMRKKNGK